MEFSLPPLLRPQVADFLQTEGEAIANAVNMFGSPLHIIFPEMMRGNVEQFRAVFRAGDLSDAQLYFAAKANKADAFLEEAAHTGIGVDVSSLEELRAALGRGVVGSNISVSGPGKQERLMALAIQHGSTISIDSAYELDDLLSVCARMNAMQKNLASY